MNGKTNDQDSDDESEGGLGASTGSKSMEVMKQPPPDLIMAEETCPGKCRQS